MHVFSKDMFISNNNPFGSASESSLSPKKKKVKSEASTKDMILKGINQGQIIEDLLKKKNTNTLNLR